ncbi:L-rhamnose mutarotase, partial [Isoptericola cucumis]
MTGPRPGDRRRVMFQFRVRPELLDEYAREHAAVWPEMLRALQGTGWENYSIFTAPDGLVVGYFESTDPDGARAGMGLREVNARWQAAMARFFAGAGPDEQMAELTEIFHLETQLAALDPAGATHPT